MSSCIEVMVTVERKTEEIFIKKTCESIFCTEQYHEHKKMGCFYRNQ